MERDIEHSLLAAKKEWDEEPMKEFYGNLIVGYPSRLRVRKILRELGDLKGKKVLDVGCEAGYVSREIIEKKFPEELYGVDVIQEALDEFSSILKKKNYKTKVTLKKGFLQKMPFEKEKFDALVCTEVIEHAPRLDLGFKEMARVLKNKGRLILTFPNEKLREKTHFFVKLFGINTDIEKEVTLFHHNPRKIIGMLRNHFIIKKYYRFPFYFPMTHLIVCEKAS